MPINIEALKEYAKVGEYEKKAEGELPAKRIKRITSHVGLSRYMDTLQDTGKRIKRIPEIPSPYAYSPDHLLYLTPEGQQVFIVETRHKTYDVFLVPPDAKQYASEEELFEDMKNQPKQGAKKSAAAIIQSDNDLGEKMEAVMDNIAQKQEQIADQPGGVQEKQEFTENTHEEAGVPVTDGDIKHTERPNVTAIKDAIEGQAEMEIGKPIDQKQEEVEAAKDKAEAGGSSVSIPAGKGVTININVTAKNKVAYVSKCPGHRNSKGELAEWCIKQHDTDKILESFKSEGAAKEGLKNMESHKHGATDAENPNDTRHIDTAPIGGEHGDKNTLQPAGGPFGGVDLNGHPPNFEKHSEVSPTRPLTCVIRDEMGTVEEAGHVNTTAEAAQWFQERGINIYSEVEGKDDGKDTVFTFKRGSAHIAFTLQGKVRIAHFSTKKAAADFEKKAKAKFGSKIALCKKADYNGWSNWLTWHVALLIDNTEASYNTKINLTRNALKKGMTPAELGNQFARFFKKQEKETRDFAAANAEDARSERGQYEREQLEGGAPKPTQEQLQSMSREQKVKYYGDQFKGLFYDIGGTSSWEEELGDLDWEEIATSAMDEERLQNPDAYPQTSKADDKMLKDMGIKMNSLKTAAKPMPAKGSPEWHQLKIAIKTLQMPDAMVGVMGGPDKATSRSILAEYGIDPAKYEGSPLKTSAKDTNGKTVGYCKTQGHWNMHEKGTNCKEWQEKPHTETEGKKAGEGAAKSPEDIEKEAGFNLFFPGQVVKEFYPDLQHEIVDYPNATNSPMLYPDISGDAHELPSEQAIEAAVEASLDPTIVAYVSTDPAGAMGIGRDGKPQVLEGAPFRKEDEIRGPMFYDEFFMNQSTVPGKAINSIASKKATDPAADGHSKVNNRGAGQMFMEEYHANYTGGPALKAIAGKIAGADEAKQFALFLQKVCGEIAATFVAAFKVTNRPILDKVPGTGEIQLANIEQPQGLSSFNLVNTQSRVKYLLDKLTDSEVQDAINTAFAQAAVWHEGDGGGFVYEVFVRIENIDTDSMIAKYKFVCGTKE